jgi:hypothetical protein
VAQWAPQPYSPQPYSPQPHNSVEQSPIAQQYPYGSPYGGQPHMAQAYPAQPIHHQPPAYGHAAPPSYSPQSYAPVPYAPQSSSPAPGYDPVRSNGVAQPYGQPPFTTGYSEQPPSAPTLSPGGVGAKKAWGLSDDAPRYIPPETEEVDRDPFGLAALPEQVAYHGPKEVPSEAVYGLLFGLCSLALFPLAFLGFARARRAGSMIDAAPSHFRGRLVVLAGFALNVACPIVSVAAGAYLFGVI